MRRLHRLQNARNWRIRAGHAPQVLGAEGYPWHHRPQRGRWAVNPLIRVSVGDPQEGQMVHVLVFQVNFPDSERCQVLHGAATWCLPLPRTLKSSVGMLYGLFRVDLYALSYLGAIDVVVWQWEVNLSDSER